MTGEIETDNPQTIMHVELVCIFPIFVAQTLTQHVQHQYHSTTFWCTGIQLPVHSHATASAVDKVNILATQAK